MSQKKVGIAMLVSGKVFSKITNITHDNKVILLMIKRLNHYEERTNFKKRRCHKHLEKEAVLIIRIQGFTKNKSPMIESSPSLES